jgi:hypothetical protein
VLNSLDSTENFADSFQKNGYGIVQECLSPHVVASFIAMIEAARMGGVNQIRL